MSYCFVVIELAPKAFPPTGTPTRPPSRDTMTITAIASLCGKNWHQAKDRFKYSNRAVQTADIDFSRHVELLLRKCTLKTPLLSALNSFIVLVTDDVISGVLDVI